MSIADTRTALAEAFDSIEGLRCTGYMRDQVNPPEVLLDYRVDPHEVLDLGGAGMVWTAKVYLPRTADRSSQDLADRLKDPTDLDGITYVLEHWTTSASTWDYLRVRELREIQEANIGDLVYLMFEVEIQVGL